MNTRQVAWLCFALLIGSLGCSTRSSPTTSESAGPTLVPSRSEAAPAPSGKSEWQLAIRHAKLQHEYQEPGESERAFGADGSERLFAAVGIEFEALAPTPGSLQDRLAPSRDTLSAEEMEYLADTKVPPLVKSIGRETASEVLAKPARLFLSTKAELVLPDGTGLRP